MSIYLTGMFTLTTLMASFPSNSEAAFGDILRNVTSVVSRAMRGGKVGTLIRYEDESGRVIRRVFFERSTPEVMQQSSPRVLSEELRLANANAEAAETFASTTRNAMNGIDSQDAAAAEQALEALMNNPARRTVQETQSQIEAMLSSRGLLIERPQLPPGATPQQIEEAYQAAIRRATNRHATDRNGRPLNVFADSFRRFPFDAASFFVALGAIATWDLVFNYNENPVAYDQFLDGQKDPIGMFSFYAFMVANGAADRSTQYLITKMAGERALHNRALRTFLPYFGMTFGMAASHIVTEVAHFPHLMDCARDMVAGRIDYRQATANPDSCTQAYNSWVHEFNMSDSISSFAPALGSMWLSTFAAGSTQLLTGMAVSAAADAVFDVRHIKISRFLTPAKFGMRFGGSLVQIGLFLLYDKVFNQMIAGPWTNAVDGDYLNRLDSNVTRLMRQYTTSGWTNTAPALCDEHSNRDRECTNHLVYNLKKLKTKLESWRTFNMNDVVTQHANWQSMVNPSSTMMFASESFYREFINATKEGRSGVVGRKLFHSYPTYGILPDGMNMEQMSRIRPLYINYTEAIEPQLRTVQKTADFLESAQVRNSADYRSLSQADINYLTETIRVFRGATMQSNLTILGNRLKEINHMLGRDQLFVEEIVGNYVRGRLEHTDALRRILDATMARLGRPRPLMQQGDAFTVMYEEDPEFKASIEALQFGWARKVGLDMSVLLENMQVGVQFLRPTGSMLAHMTFGADTDRNQQMFRDSQIMRDLLGGMPAVFMGPRITKNFAINQRTGVDFIDHALDALAGGNIFTNTYSFSGTRLTPFQLLRNQNNLRPEVLNDFNGWWQQNVVREQFIPAWTHWEREYLSIMPKLVRRLWRQDNQREGIVENVLGFFRREGTDLSVLDGPRRANGDSTFNTSPVANGIIEELRQERKLYMLIMGEVLKSARQNYTQANSHSFAWPQAVNVEAPNSLLRYLRVSPSLNMADFNRQGEGLRQFTNYRFQAELNYHFNQLERLLSNLQVRQVSDRMFGADQYAVVSRVSNTQFQAQVTTITNKINQVKTQIEALHLPDLQKKTADVCVQGILAVAEQLKFFGEVMNAVSYVDHQGNGTAGEMPVRRECVQAAGAGSIIDRRSAPTCQ